MANGNRSSSSSSRESTFKGKIKTALWPHQQATAQRVVDGVKQGRKGFADASAVGAGKTLGAIATMVKVASYKNDEQGQPLHGFLVLLPNKRLIDEWKSQIEKHTIGFKIIIQQSNGKLLVPTTTTTTKDANTNNKRRKQNGEGQVRGGGGGGRALENCNDEEVSKELGTLSTWRGSLYHPALS
eukprot:jgi/Bigna1/141594/aug1.63_g16302